MYTQETGKLVVQRLEAILPERILSDSKYQRQVEVIALTMAHGWQMEWNRRKKTVVLTDPESGRIFLYKFR